MTSVEIFESKDHEEKVYIYREDNGRLDRVMYKYGRLHCDYAPAIDHEDEHRTKRWYLHGEEIQCNSQEEFELMMKFIPFW